MGYNVKELIAKSGASSGSEEVKTLNSLGVNATGSSIGKQMAAHNSGKKKAPPTSLLGGASSLLGGVETIMEVSDASDLDSDCGASEDEDENPSGNSAGET